MKNNISDNLSKKRLASVLFVLTLLIFVGNSAIAQVNVNFQPRSSVYTPGKTIYNVKGDFTMMGNTNLTLVNYGDNTSNANDMRYVDVDGDINTLNSSSATLQFSNENGALPDCSNIIYAGLYWSGRAGSDQNFTVNKEVPTGNMVSEEVTDEGVAIYNNGNIDKTDYSLTITYSGSNNYFTFIPSGGGNTVRFRYRQNGNNSEVRLYNGFNWNTSPIVNTSSIDNNTAYFSTPYEIYSDSNYTLEVTRLYLSSWGNSWDRAYVDVTYNETVPEVVTVTKNYDKRKISIKGPNASGYTELTANANDIYYPTNSEAYIYAAYTEITDYVKTNGLGEYFVADMALREGDPDGTGYFGGWGMVVVYENSKMNWRDITVFDGYAYVNSSNDDEYIIDVDGFHAAQNGNVNVKLGVMAGEGDAPFTGDAFQIENRNTGNYTSLSHTGNSTTNFFNSSIVTGGNPRNPTLLNNTGIDISMFNINNSSNSIIDNSQTSTSFKYYTDGDTYSIFNVTFAVDAYVPETEGVVTGVSIGGGSSVPPSSSLSIEPGETIEFTVDIKNKGTEAIENAVLTIPVPYTSAYQNTNISYTTNPSYSLSPNSQPEYDPNIGATGAIVWDIGDLPEQNDPDDWLYRLNFEFTATTDCAILSNTTCQPLIALTGYITGNGVVSGTSFNQDLIQGYETSGVCEGEPIPIPLNITIDKDDYVNQHCASYDPVRDFYFCNRTTDIQTSEVEAQFPPGTMFYNEYPVEDTSIRYTSSNPFPATPGQTTYFGVPPGLSSCYYEFTINVNTINSTPDVNASDVTYCLNETAVPLTATPTVPGYVLLYYTDDNPATIGQASLTPPTDVAGEFTYYVAEGFDEDCMSPTRVPITVTINDLPDAPVSNGDITECETSPIQTLDANDALSSTTGITWYDAATGGSVVATPTLNTVGSATYYAEYNDGTCTSLTRTAVVLTITGAPAAPVSSGDITECETSPIQTLDANDALSSTTGITWYDAATGGSVVANPTLNTVGSATYYAEYNDGTCTSLTRTAVVLTITGAPAAPVSNGDITECETSPIQTLDANDALSSTTGITWYDASTGGSVVATPTLNTVGSATYYAEYNDGTCTSLTRTAVVLTITGAPAAPVSSGDITECETSPIQTLDANDALSSTTGITWYDAATGGSVVATPTLNTVGSATYYAEYNDGTCTSLTRTAVVLTITGAPAAPVSNGDITECETSPIQTLDANDALSSTTGITWYDAATGGSVVANPTLNTVGSATYYAEYNDGTCTSLTRTAVVLTITGAPAAPVSSGDITECETSPIQTLDANDALSSTTGITWYDAATGGSVVANPTLNTVGSATYYAEYNDGTCTSLTRTAVVLTITGAPAAPVSSGDITECETSPIQTLDANDALSSTTGITWYDAATGGSVVATPTLNTVGSATYYAEYNDGTCTSLTRTAVVLTITGAPAAPVSSGDITECETSPIQTLDANDALSSTTGITWYDAATGGSVVATPTLNTVGSATYYAEYNDGTCTSLTRTAVVLTITGAPAAPVSNGDITECETSPIQTLDANDALSSTTGITWYDAATGGSVVATPTLNTVGSATYYAEYNDGTCTSLTRTAVVLTITGAPAAPVSSGDITECETSPIQTLDANDALSSTTGITWYDAATGGSVVATPTLNTVGSATYYAEYNDGTCTSLTRTAVVLTITGAPAAPVSSGDITECETSPIQTLDANDALSSTTGITWYDAATGGSVVATPTLNTVGSATYYAEYNDGTCTSLTRTAVVLTITGAPAAPVSSGDITECETSPIQTLDANDALSSTTGITWYDAATGGSVVANPTLNTVGSATYYAEYNDGTCTSLTRTAVVLTITGAPAAPVSSGDITECETSPIQTLDANDALSSTTGITWYDAATGGSVVANPTLNTVGSATYYAEYNDGTCTSLTRTAVVLTITGAPAAPVSSGDITECETSPIQTLDANDALSSTTGITWYDAATGGSVVANPTLNTVGSATYYAEYNDGTCTSLTRTAVVLTITGAPAAPVSSGDITECETSPIQTLDANDALSSTTGITWYDAATGGSVVANPTLNTVGSATYYAEYNDGTCTSLTRTAVVLTITGAPAAPVSSGDITECETSPIQTLDANDALSSTTGITWYDAATGGSVVANPTLNTVGSATYYAEYNDGTCTSLTRTAVVLTITGAPAAPVSNGDITECETSPIQTLDANDALSSTTGITWYDAATGGSVVANPTLNTVGSATYYAEYNDGTCTSLTRTAVVLTITGAPAAPVSSGDITECETSPIQTLDANDALSSTTGITWYDAATGGSVVATPTLNTVGSATYYAEYNDGTCTSLTRTAVVLTITGAPAAPVSSGDITECETSPIQTLDANDALSSTTGITWYDAATGGNVVANPTLNTVGSATYYAEYNDGTCTSLTRTAVVLTITGAPAAPVSSGDITECETSPIQTLDANDALSSTTGITWYDAATGGSVVATPTLNTVGSATYYAEYNDGTCTSLTRTAVVLTITGAPAAPVSSGDITECETSPIQTLDANDALSSTTGITWYDAATGGSVVATPTLNTVGSATYYAEYNDGTCTSLTRTAVVLTITGAPAAPVSSGDIIECETSPIQTLDANNALSDTTGITWYDAATGGNVVANPTLNTVGSATYYAEYNDGTCTSLTRTAVVLTITGAPAAPVSSGDITECETSPIQTLDANDALSSTTGITWYDAATGGSVVANPTLNTVGSATYYAEYNDGTCTSLTRTAVVLTITGAPAAPVSSGDITECETSPIQTLDANDALSSTTGITWYDAATGGSVVANPTLNTVGSATYYAEYNDGTCTSLTRTAVVLTITGAPAAPVSNGDITECETSPIQTLDANDALSSTTGITWYDAATGGSVVANPTLNTVGSATYYAEYNDGTCTSLTRTAVVLTITGAPAAPVSSGDITECETSPIQTLDANDALSSTTGITWYDAATGGSVVATPTLNTVGSATYYAEYNDGTCTSLTRTAVVLTITGAPAAPVSSGDITECETSPIQTLDANDALSSTTGITWYDAATGGNVVANPTLNTVGSATYYAEYNDGTCTSLTRTAVVLTITGAPAAPVSSGDITECETSPIQTLDANDALSSTTGITWYDAATGGSVVATPTLNTVGSATYYAEYNDGTCTSLTRTAVVLTITGAPAAPVSSGDITECETSPIQTLDANDALSSTTGITWYDAATGGSVVATPTLNTVGSATYYAEYNDGTCTSLTRTAVVLTITGAPAAPISNGDITECETSPIQTLDANDALSSTTGITWYDAATGGSVVANPTLNTVGSATYYAEYNDGTCTSLTRTAVVLTITGAPAAPVSSGDITECETSPIQTLDANDALSSTTGITWYDAATGGSVVATPTLNTVGSATYYAEYNDGTCTSLTRTAVVLTITGAPAAPVSSGDITECETSPIQTLDANNALSDTTGITWYDAATGGNVVANPTLNTVGSATYYAEYNDGTCTSLTRTAVVLTITGAPAAPVSSGDITECETSPIQTLDANDALSSTTGITWYDAATGGSVVANPTLNTVGSATYYAEYNDGTCTSLTRTAVVLTITGAPAAPVSSGDITECETSPIQTLDANDALSSTTGITWYDAATGGSVVANPTLNTVGSATYYAEYNDGTCTSLTRTAVVLTITGAPAAPVSSGDITECETSPIQTLDANDALSSTTGITWYDAATGGSVVANPTLNTVGSATYYAEYNDGTCTSLTRTAVVLTITGAPAAPVSNGDITECETSPIQTLDANDALSSTTGITWYDAATGGSVVANPTLNTVGSATYYAEYNDGTCTSLTRTAVVLTITGAPAAPVSSGDITECETSPIQTLDANDALSSTTGITWYDAATGGSVVATPTLNTVGSATYYAEYNDGTCTSLTRTAVTLTINKLPAVSVSTDATEISCADQEVVITATATVQGTASYLWSNGETTQSITVTAAGTYSVVVTDSDNGCSVTSDDVIIGEDTTVPTVSVSADATEISCADQEVVITATATVQGTASYLWSNGETTQSITVTAAGTYSVVVTDSDNGCSVTSDDVIIGEDTTAPSVNISTDDDELSCTNSDLVITATPSVQGTASYLWSTGETTQSVTVTAAGTYTVTVTDSDNGCTVDGSIEITFVGDSEAPTFTVPADITVACDTDITDLSVTGDVTDEADNCATGIEAIYSDTVEPGDCPNESIITRTWILTDGNNNTTTHVQFITVMDTTAPEFVEALPQDITVNEGDIPDAETLTAVDNCGDATVTFSESIVNESKFTYDIVRTWIAADACGNEVMHSQTVHVNIPGELPPPAPPVPVDCDNIPEVPDHDFSNYFPGDITVTFEETSDYQGLLEDYNITRTWTITEADGTVHVYTEYLEVYVNNDIQELPETELCVEDAVIDLNSLLPDTAQEGGEWTVEDGDADVNGSFFDPSGLELGIYTLQYKVTNTSCPEVWEIKITVHDECVILPCGRDDVIVSKTITPNGDAYNQYFTVTGVEACGFTINVKIFNRWGHMIYEAENYQNNWDGATTRSAFGRSGTVPSGTYYYIIDLKDSGIKPITGYIFVGTK
ncbi:gliding motility-associated C-terminal domain-containing protein [Zhouia spongiae]|uniref:Gliding motility-associated C-terminal domain-containing protein n=1 Tax=Zhouia spongiae TaxID=2202721 RepID=A0ABY3YL52_9FLAO|nr:gliding motility-associated C-terminal domain-containing protein [Zhouia spongiae]UNY98524.1 gliding motility-associated C-terminal domain-containing protein [Zhouia spongiae]